MKRTPNQVLVFALLASVDAIFLFARAATQSGTWPLGIYKNQTITMKNFNTEDNYGGESDGVGEILFEASLTSLTKGELILGSTNHANAADGKHNVGAKIIALQAEQDLIMSELAGLTPPSPPPEAPVSICVDLCKASLVSPNGKYEARTQTDGNFVVYEGATTLWASGTYGQGTGPYELRMQTNGNLVLYDSNEIATWSTDTQGRGSGPYTLVMQDDSNLVIYCNFDELGTGAPIWSSYYGTESTIRC